MSDNADSPVAEEAPVQEATTEKRSSESSRIRGLMATMGRKENERAAAVQERDALQARLTELMTQHTNEQSSEARDDSQDDAAQTSEFTQDEEDVALTADVETPDPQDSGWSQAQAEPQRPERAGWVDPNNPARSSNSVGVQRDEREYLTSELGRTLEAHLQQH